jgi:hypothetical protein
MLPSMSGSSLRIEIDAGVPGAPIQGHVHASSGERMQFAGWIELVALVEAARAESTAEPETGRWPPRREKPEESR